MEGGAQPALLVVSLTLLDAGDKRIQIVSRRHAVLRHRVDQDDLEVEAVGGPVLINRKSHLAGPGPRWQLLQRGKHAVCRYCTTLYIGHGRESLIR